MAQIIIDIPDQVVTRVRRAFGRSVPATMADIQEELKNYIKGRTLEFEVAETATVRRDDIGREVW